MRWPVLVQPGHEPRWAWYFRGHSGVMNRARERAEDGAGARAGLGLDGKTEVASAYQGGDRFANERGRPRAGWGGARRE